MKLLVDGRSQTKTLVKVSSAKTLNWTEKEVASGFASNWRERLAHAQPPTCSEIRTVQLRYLRIQRQTPSQPALERFLSGRLAVVFVDWTATTLDM